MARLKDKYQSGDALAHLQVHNVWPITISAIVTFVGLIFASGQNYNKFVRLQEDFNTYQTKTDARLAECKTGNEDLMKLYVDLSNKMPVVKGASTKVASPPANLKVPYATWTPTPAGRK